MILRKAKYLISNIMHLLRCKKFKADHHDGLVLGPCSRCEISAMGNIYELLNGVRLSALLRIIMLMGAPRTCMVAKDGKQIVGVNFYYVNKIDVQKNTVHEGFIGVKAQHQGKGIASAMRKAAQSHFRAAGYSGISTRIDLDNHPSYQSARKCGFEVINEYRDDETGHMRAYMVVSLLRSGDA